VSGLKHLKNHPHREELIEKGKLSTFYGVPVADLDKEDLLMMVGKIGEDKARDDEFRRKSRDLERGFNRAR
jgi:hypothetical protein